MTTNQPSSLAEIKERIKAELDNAMFLDEDGQCEHLDMLPKELIKLVLSTIDQSYELGRSVGRAEPHNTENGYCCACEYDIACFEEKLANLEIKKNKGNE